MKIVPITEGDLELTVSLECDPEVMAHLGGPRQREDAVNAHYRRLGLMGWGEAWMYKIVLADGAVAGTVGVWETEWQESKTHEMGWLLIPAFHGRGIATEAARMVLENVRDDERFREVHAFPATDNIASNRICQKLGFELLGDVPFEFGGHALRCSDWRLALRA